MSDHPPRPPFVLTIGVTGHRAQALGAFDQAGLADRLRRSLEAIAEAAGAVMREMPARDSHDQRPTLRLLSPLADGADQIAAGCALDLGWELEVALPFSRDEYRPTLNNDAARAQFDLLVARASAVLELPGDPADPVGAYVMAGRATVAHCDILLAVWDGSPARGHGGTAEVVALALARGVAVTHLNPDERLGTALLWSGFDPEVLTVSHDVGIARPFDSAGLRTAIRGMCLPPAEITERQFLDRFCRERRRRIRTRLEYPLLLAIAGVKRLQASDIRESRSTQAIRQEWHAHRANCAQAHAEQKTDSLLETAYLWADSLAAHFAQTYRSGHIFGFLLGGVAVCIGLSAFMAPRWKLEFAAIELVITFLIIANAWIGTREEWHRRWLDYRQLAERLRPMRSLKLLGIASPDPQGTATNPVPRRWVESYAAAIWRSIGCPTVSFDREAPTRLAQAIADFEVAPQVAYHRRNAQRVEKLDRRLEGVAYALFIATLATSMATIVGIATGSPFLDRYGNWFNLVQSGFPALGTAVFGIRFQADFGGDALRSLSTADTLQRIDQELRRDAPLSRAADLTEQAARIMLADVEEWRLVNQQRELEFG